MYQRERRLLSELRYSIKALRDCTWGYYLQIVIRAAILAIACVAVDKELSGLTLIIINTTMFALFCESVYELNWTEFKRCHNAIKTAKARMKKEREGKADILNRIERLSFAQENLLDDAWTPALTGYEGHPRQNELITALIDELPKLVDLDEDNQVRNVILFTHGFMMGDIQAVELPELEITL